MSKRSYEFVVVGSGAGGATVASELARRGREVLVVERGRRERNLGRLLPAYGYYDSGALGIWPRKSREGVIIWTAHMAGGTTVVSCGNGVPCLEKELAALGADVSAELREVAAEMGVAPACDELLSGGAARIGAAAAGLGYRMVRMPKFINAARCNRCAQCVLGCRRGAKWTALSYLDDAVSHGAHTLYGTTVREIIVERARARGLRVTGPDGQMEIRAGAVILAAGGLASPVILQRAGLKEAGAGLFADLFVNTYGVTRDVSLAAEPTMTLVDDEFRAERGFILSPFINPLRVVRYYELGLRGAMLPTSRLLGIMTKISDEPTGRVGPDGRFSKAVTPADRSKLDAGSAHSARILAAAGADPKSIVVSRVQGAHPGGTAAIGKVVDAQLQTAVERLFVCDASVLPTSPGLPPILTICALARRLGRQLAA